MLQLANERNDDWGRQVAARLNSVIDIVAAEGRYHQSCRTKFKLLPTDRKRGRPESEVLTNALHKLYEFMTDSDECQYSVGFLLNKLEEFLPVGSNSCSERTLKDKLKEHFQSDIIISSNTGMNSVACFRNTGHKILS